MHDLYKMKVDAFYSLSKCLKKWENLQKFSSKTDRMYDESINTLKHEG